MVDLPAKVGECRANPARGNLFARHSFFQPREIIMTSLNVPERAAIMEFAASSTSEDWLSRAAPAGLGLLALLMWMGGGLVALVPRWAMGEQVLVSIVTACSGIALAWIGRGLKIELAKLANEKYHNTRIRCLEKEIDRLKFLADHSYHGPKKPEIESHDSGPAA